MPKGVRIDSDNKRLVFAFILNKFYHERMGNRLYFSSELVDKLRAVLCDDGKN